MERLSPALQRLRSSPRAARKSEWLRCALAHHHHPEPGVENEVIVLATGIDQYLQEVFHHLALPGRDDTVSADDFAALCAVLGLSEGRRGKEGLQEEEEEDDEESTDVCSGLPNQVTFKDFHSRLCGYFGAQRSRKESPWRLPGSEESELVERQIRLRWPRVRRRKSVSFDLSQDRTEPTNRSLKGRSTEDRETDEAAALRELVEDLRAALQGSDARCLALEVALRRGRTSLLPSASHYNTAASPGKSSITLVQGKLVPTQRLRGQLSGAGRGEGGRRAVRRRDIRDPLQRELRLIRSARDGQLEEAIKFNQRMEEELQWAYQEVRKLQRVESALRKENAQIRRRAEEAREALSLGLQRVRMIQEQAQCVPQLQSRVSQLEAELLQYRSSCTCTPTTTTSRQTTSEDMCSKIDAECLQRAVEGKAASDEEEEERGGREEGPCCQTEVKRHIGRMHGCDQGCQNHLVHRLLSQKKLHEKNPTSNSLESRGRCSWRASNPEPPKGKEKTSEEEEGKIKLQEKTRLSELEDKLTDSLALLLQLRNRIVSRSILRRIVMDTLDDPSQVLQVAEALSVQLSSGDHGERREDDEGGRTGGRGGGHETSSANPSLIWC